MAQPISDRVDEMVTGVRADVAVKIFGDDLDTAGRTGRTKSRGWRRRVRGTADIKVDRVAGQQNLNVDDRPAGHRAPWAERLGCARRDRGRHRRARRRRRSTKASGDSRRWFGFRSTSANNVDEIRNILITAPSGARIPLESLARDRVAGGRLADQAGDGEAAHRRRR